VEGQKKAHELQPRRLVQVSSAPQQSTIMISVMATAITDTISTLVKRERWGRRLEGWWLIGW